jgi:hypothetical protein
MSDSIAEIIITALLSKRKKKKKKKLMYETETEYVWNWNRNRVCVCMYACMESFLRISLRRIISLHINSEGWQLSRQPYLSEDEASHLTNDCKP